MTGFVRMGSTGVSGRGFRSGERERLRMEHELVETSCGLVGAGVERVTLYRFVDAQKDEGFPVRLACSVVGVSPSAYYAYKQRPQPGAARLAEDLPVDKIRAIWADSSGTYGSPRVCAELRRRGLMVNHKRVAPVDETPSYGRFRASQAACHHHRGHRSSDP